MRFFLQAHLPNWQCLERECEELTHGVLELVEICDIAFLQSRFDCLFCAGNVSITDRCIICICVCSEHLPEALLACFGYLSLL